MSEIDKRLDKLEKTMELIIDAHKAIVKDFFSEKAKEDAERIERDAKRGDAFLEVTKQANIDSEKREKSHVERMTRELIAFERIADAIEGMRDGQTVFTETLAIQDCTTCGRKKELDELPANISTNTLQCAVCDETYNEWTPKLDKADK